MKNMTFAYKLFEHTIAAPCFAPERDDRFPNKEIRAMAYFALRSLWRAQSIRYKSLYFTQPSIRRILRKNIMPDYLDDAIKLWLMLPHERTFHDLVCAIFYVVLVGEEFYKDAAATYSKPDYDALYNVWLYFRTQTIIVFAPMTMEVTIAYAV